MSALVDDFAAHDWSAVGAGICVKRRRSLLLFAAVFDTNVLQVSDDVVSMVHSAPRAYVTHWSENFNTGALNHSATLPSF
jgi:hypothetical protein